MRRREVGSAADGELEARAERWLAADSGVETRAQRWLAADPDPETRAELRELLSGNPAELRRRFSGRLAFGTAGIRGAMGPGPTRMNRVLVRIVAAAVAERVLRDGGDDPHVVVGYDARYRSRDFAGDTARVMAARGIGVTVLAEPMPTPVLAFAVKHLDASAGVMVTASHNPRTDNGYKVYWRGGQLLAAPIDTEIGEIIDRTEPLAESELAPFGQPDNIAIAGEDLVEAYVEAVVGLLAPEGPRSVQMAYTPLHGVGAETFLRALARAGFERPALVSGQAEPDPAFPTTAFPNPEETGVLDRLLALAERERADVALAHDPDADRLAVAVPHRGRWRLLTGDETGCLLAEHLLSRAAGSGPADGGSRRPLVINTVVSSHLLPRIAAHHDADWAETLTGFKWIMQAAAQRSHSHNLVLGYEDALGYAVGEAVSDKDGIGAALVTAELVAELKAAGRTLCDLLDDLHRRHGAHATGQRSVRFESVPASERARPQRQPGSQPTAPTMVAGEPEPQPSRPQRRADPTRSDAVDADAAPMQRAMAELRHAPPADLAGAEVTAVHDMAAGDGNLPPADVVVLELSGLEARVIVRPSGTEPKMKVYAEAVVPVGTDSHDASGKPSIGVPRDAYDHSQDQGSDVRSAQGEARSTITRLLDEAVRHVADPERLARSRRLADSAAPTGGRSGFNADTARVTAPMGMATPATSDRVDDLRLVVRCTDLTILEGDDTPGRIRALCSQALRPDPADPTVGPVAAVCVYPSLAAVAAELLAGTQVAVASVAGAFPSGLSPLDVKAAEVEAAVAAGATEIDTVLNRSAFLSGRHDIAAQELRALREAAGAARFKVILEVCELGSPEAVAEATRLAIDAGADMVKTSTGKGASGASPSAVTTMAATVAEHVRAGGRPVGIKVSGGVRTAADALVYLDIVSSLLGEAWLTPDRLRFGASSLLSNVIDTLTAA